MTAKLADYIGQGIMIGSHDPATSGVECGDSVADVDAVSQIMPSSFAGAGCCAGQVRKSRCLNFIMGKAKQDVQGCK